MLLDPLDPAAHLPWEAQTKIEPAAPGLPGVSIVIPIYNAGKFLEKTLRSLMCNDLTGVELIVMDGGSTDNTADILAHYAEIFSHCQSAKDGGQSDAINQGYTHATQPILYWLNGDDVILPNTLNAVRQVFADRPDTQVVVGDAYMTEADFSPIRHFTFGGKLSFAHLLDYAQNHLVQPSVFFTRTAWDHAGPVKEEMHYAMDADLFLTMAQAHDFVHLPLDIAYSVYHEDCKTRGNRAESITELAMIQAAHGGMAEARRTLDVLVGLYNKDTKTPARQLEQTSANVLKRRINAIEAEAAETLQRLVSGTALRSTS
jgi:glycosyltransferase involved in cell wall biosynthesis